MDEIEEERYREPKRARRIRDRTRMIAKGRTYRLQLNWWSNDEKHRLHEAEMHGRYYHDHLAICSCDGCGNQRRSGWTAGQFKLTMQERKAGVRPKHRKQFEKELDI